MTLTQQDAHAALREVESTLKQSATLRGYQSMAPHLFIWGAVWAIGYISNYALPGRENTIWPIISMAGVIGDIAASRADHGGEMPAALPRLLAVFLLFIAAAFAVLQPHDPRQAGAFIPLVIAAAYGVLGSFAGRRILALGAALGALTVGGFFLVPGTLFFLWMAAVGGGGLILGGLWLRHA